jgi:AcrR family transcriptional regulator
MRADAQRNSARIIAVAKEVFAESSIDAPLDEIVKRAGIGAGTLYRHFPTRDQLLEAIYREEIVALAELGRRLHGELPPEQAMGAWLHAQLTFIFANKGLARSLKAAMDHSSENFEYCRTAMRAAAAELLAPLHESGVISKDIEVLDLLRMAHGISVATEADGPERGHKLLDIMLTGLGLPTEPVA